MTNKTQAMINEAMRESGNNLSAVSRALGLNYQALRQRYPNVKPTLHSAAEPEPADISTLGRKNFQQYVVAVKPAGSGWPDKYDDAIDKARKAFDAGTHEMFQTTDNGWVILYSIPYLVPIERRQFFSTMIVMK